MSPPNHPNSVFNVIDLILNDLSVHKFHFFLNGFDLDF